VVFAEALCAHGLRQRRDLSFSHARGKQLGLSSRQLRVFASRQRQPW
jgi:hypothetical protein